MTDVVAYAKVFAAPVWGDAADTVSTLARGRLNSTRRRITKALVEIGRQEEAKSLMDFTAGIGNAWRPETGLALLAHRNRSPALAAMHAALAYAGMGGGGRLSVLIEDPEWLYLDGWLLPVQGQCHLTADSASISVSSDLGKVTCLPRTEEGRWVPADSCQGPWLAYASGGLAPRYVTATGLCHSVEGFPWISANPPLEHAQPLSAADSRIAVIHEGWKLILDKTPVYGSWVASTAAGCLLLDPSGSHKAQSGSSYDHPGLIAMEPPEGPVFCGELLVHECSHQHLLVYMMVAPLVQAGTRETSYSPIKRATRAIDRVLMGAHAVGNMIIYYAILSQTMTLDKESQLRFKLHRDWFAEDYRPALEKSESLTPAGRTLWQSLCQAVDSSLEN